MHAKLKIIQNWPSVAHQANWSVNILAIRCGVSRDTLRRFFIEHMGKPPKEWLMEHRQHHANELLRSGISIKEAAALLGYKQQSNFTRQFKKYWGVCPSVQTTGVICFESARK